MDKLKVLYMKLPWLIDHWHEDVFAAVGSKHEIVRYDPARPLAEQFEGVDVVVDQGGLQGTPEMFDLAGRSGARLWQVQGTGLDAVDVDAILARGLILCNTPGHLSAAALAEHALLLMLILLKNYKQSEEQVERGQNCGLMNEDLKDKTLGLVGFGASARQLAKRAWAMEMRLMASDLHPISRETAEEYHLDFAGSPEDFNQIIQQADVVSLHVPLTDETRRMIDRSVLRAMKKEAILINVARGELIDEQALVEALRNQEIRGAGMDVCASEPIDPNHPLLKLDNVVYTPHIAGSTADTSRQRAQAIADNIDRVAQGLEPLHQVPGKGT